MISARVHYAALALVELAIRRDSQNPVAVREIAERNGIPGPFLVQILRTLRRQGWVQSVRGSQGGYRLLVEPSELTLLEIADAVGCPEASCHTESNDTPADRQLHEVWAAANTASRQVLSETTLAQIVDRSTTGQGVMFYI